MIIVTQILTFLLSALADYVAIYLGFSIVGVAVTTSVAYFVFSNVLLFFTFKLYIKKGLLVFKEIAKIYLPLIYLGVLLIISYLLVPNPAHVFWNDVLLNTVRFLVLCLLYVPLVYHFDREIGLFGFLKNMLFKKTFMKR